MLGTSRKLFCPNMAASTSDMSFWIKFFKDAGIPAGDAANYAVTFTDNRMTRDMLLDLSKEYLKDMGISILGDIISILKHAKTVTTQFAREKALKDTERMSELTPSPKRSTPASRIVGHYIGSDRSESPQTVTQPKISKELSARLGTPKQENKAASVIKLNSKPKEEVPVPKSRRVFPEHEGKYKISMPSGTTARSRQILEQQRKKAEVQRLKKEQERASQAAEKQKTSVFSRLGSEKPKTEPTITITGLGNIAMPTSSQSSVFKRLGGKSPVKRAATSTVVFDDDDSDLEESTQGLEYAGVLKNPAALAKKAKLEAAKKLKKTAQKRLTLRVQDEPEVSTTAGVLSPEARLESKDIKSRLGPKRTEVTSTTHVTASNNTIKKTITQSGIQGRLGSKVTEQTGVFKRLGKPTGS